MKDQLVNLLETFGFPVYLQGTLPKDEDYKDSFFTFWNDTTEDGNHYDNNPISTNWEFTVYFYSVNPTLVNTVLVNVKELLKQNGWIVKGDGYDVPVDVPTHTGRAIDIIFIRR